MMSGRNSRDFAFARNAQRVIEGGFRLFKMTAHHLHDPATIVGGDHIVRAVVGFGEMLASSASNVRPDRIRPAMHEPALSSCSKAPEGWIPSSPAERFPARSVSTRDRPCEMPLSIPKLAGEKIGLAKSVFDKAKPGRIVHLVRQRDGFFRQPRSPS